MADIVAELNATGSGHPIDTVQGDSAPERRTLRQRIPNIHRTRRPPAADAQQRCRLAYRYRDLYLPCLVRRFGRYAMTGAVTLTTGRQAPKLATDVVVVDASERRVGVVRQPSLHLAGRRFVGQSRSELQCHVDARRDPRGQMNLPSSTHRRRR